jgi:hypothetical protein
MTSRMVYAPASATHSTVPSMRWGTMILWSTEVVSGTVPSTSPATTASPGLATGVKSHFLSSGSGGA